MNFAHPEYLWMLSGIPLMALILIGSYRLRKQASHEFRPAKFRKAGASITAEFIYGGGVLAACALMIAAACGPYVNDKPVTVPEGAVQAVFVVDVSRSMAAEDYRKNMPADAVQVPDLNEPWGNRLLMAKYQMGRIMHAIKGNEVGLVTYTAQGFAQALPTKDLSAIRFVLDQWVDIGTAPGDGSDYANGINMALEMLKQNAQPDKQQVIVLLTDGGFTGNRTEIKKAVERLKSDNVQLVIVGIGMPGENVIPQYKDGALAGPMMVEGKVMTTSYEEDDIRELKQMANAPYVHIELDAQSQVVNVDWVSTISGSRIVFERRMLDRYLAGGAYAIIVLLVLSGIFVRRSMVV